MTVHDGGLGLALFDEANIQNPHRLYAQMHESGPVHRIGDSRFYAVSSWEAVQDAVSRCGDFSSNLTATMMYEPGGVVAEFTIGELGGATQALATADDPAHAVHRKALVPHLAAKRIQAFESFIADTVDHLWNPDADNNIEWMSAIANRLPMMVVGRIIGVPDADVDDLIRWGYAATQVVEGLVTRREMEAAGVAVMELGAYITEQFRYAAADPADNLLGDLATACAAGELDDITALAMMITLFSAGGESTASLIGSAAWILATIPDVQQQVRERPDLMGAFLEEVLRYEPPFRGHYRHVVGDTALCGVELPAGSRLVLLWGAANRDPAHFDDPTEFRLDRQAAKSHLSFGKGVHFCVGAALARLEARIVIDRLLERSTGIDAIETGRWLPSLLVRRLEHLRLAVAS
ncbi:cytochrome P450 [Mycobacterium sp. PS03-16]|uniref:cytochrome P450 n=1 Tax=Mycobacterium sp. PS03-16 TaxID=2559611 RepID=UPI00107358F5|nr:cytochrome P450 [Mycobacterium sp. PS03-16]TFV57049.1 cytochrome P450 [Mycobacterium sp. PS03-16]